MNTLLFCLDVFALSLCTVYGFWLAERWWEATR
jgi:hypothetical protein